MKKVSYFGIREEGVARVFRYREQADPKAGVPLEPRLDLRNHSPTGFEWGYGVSVLSTSVTKQTGDMVYSEA
jgi:hypothetical protein